LRKENVRSEKSHKNIYFGGLRKALTNLAPKGSFEALPRLFSKKSTGSNLSQGLSRKVLAAS
jgi:hypothetical protein